MSDLPLSLDTDKGPRFSMARIPAQASALLQELRAHLPVLLGGNLIGIYVHGSLTQRAFKSKRSDIDCIVVTKRTLSETQFEKLRAWLALTARTNPWVARLQLLFLLNDEVLTMNSKACLYQFGVLQRTRSDGNPMIWMNVLQSGRVLFGPRPESFVPAITPETLCQALERELGYLREEISDKPDSKWRDVPSYRAYAVLTVCRILYSFRKGTVVSKQRAAKWATRSLPAEWNDIVLQALEVDDIRRSSFISLSIIEQFIDFAHGQLHSDPAVPVDERG